VRALPWLAVFKSILVAAAVLLVGFGAAGAVWARCFERPPNRWLIDNSKGPKTVETNKFVPDRSPISVEAKLFPPDQAFADHVWVNSTLVQAPKYVDAPNARLVVKPKETEAGIARGRKVVEEIMARIPKSSVETPESDVGGGGGPRPGFHSISVGLAWKRVILLVIVLPMRLLWVPARIRLVSHPRRL
jgi:hypothetical protein